MCIRTISSANIFDASVNSLMDDLEMKLYNYFVNFCMN